MKYHFRRCEPEEVLFKYKIDGGRFTLGYKAPKSTTWGVFDEEGNIRMDEDVLTHTMEPSIWPNARTADQVASRLNEQVTPSHQGGRK